MIPIPVPEDYDISSDNGFLPSDPPLEVLPDPYYEPWEYVVQNLQGLILSKRLRGVVDRLPVLSTERLSGEPQWRRAYSALAFITHAYIWGGKRPAERVPPPISIPFLATCGHLQLPPVATYAGLCLWNWKPIFDSERADTLANLDMIDTFTGSLDEKWFYLVSVAIEAKGAPLIPLMLRAIRAASHGDRATVVGSLRTFAERLDDIGTTLTRMYDHCDPYVFYHRIRPFLAGSKNMADAGLPNGVIFDDGGPINKQRYVQHSGGSNAQSSMIQFFDLVLSVEHRPTGDAADAAPQKKHSHPRKSSPPQPNFIHDMRQYMPGAHARFLDRVAAVANLRAFVQERHPHDRELSVAFDASLAMLRALRDKHIQMVSRYIVIPSRSRDGGGGGGGKTDDRNPAVAMKKASINLAAKPLDSNAALKGTGGSSLIPFLRQARDETGEPAVELWARRILAQRQEQQQPSRGPYASEPRDEERCQGLAGVWHVGESGGGICLY